MSFWQDLVTQFPDSLGSDQKGDVFLCHVKDVNEIDRSIRGAGVDDVVLECRGPIHNYELRVRIEAYIRQIRPTVKRVIYKY